MCRRFLVFLVLATLAGALGLFGNGPEHAEAFPSLNFPFPDNQTWRISCGYADGGGCQHPNDQWNRHALDFERVGGSTDGKAVRAAASGTVEHAGWDNSGLGWSVRINHGGGYVTGYGHMKSNLAVSAGQSVSRGKVIGYADCSGYCTGSHIHFVLTLNGTSVKPEPMCGHTGFNDGQTYTNCTDIIPPTTTFARTGTMGENGWYVSPVKVTLTAKDNPGGSGVAGTWYRVDGRSWKKYSSPFTVSTDGSHTVRYYSKDKAGNKEGNKSKSFKIDATSPSASASLAGTSGMNGWYHSPVEVSLSATDATSGVSSIWISVDGVNFFPYTEPLDILLEGEYRVYYYSVDKAGNQGPTSRVLVSIDLVPPAGSLVINGDAPTTPGAVARLGLEASDSMSGVQMMSLSTDGSAWRDWEPFSPEVNYVIPAIADGESAAVFARFRDLSGHVSEVAWDSITPDLYPGQPSSASYRLGSGSFGMMGSQASSPGQRMFGSGGQTAESSNSDGFAVDGGYFGVLLACWGVDSDGDANVNRCDADDDDDGFTDVVEAFAGTDSLLACGPSAWPPDFDDNEWVNILDFMQLTPPVFGTSPPDPNYSVRKDLNADGTINILDILLITPPVFGSSCG